MLAELRGERMKHCSSRNGLQMAISISSQTGARGGGISIASETVHSNRWRLGKLNLEGRNGLLVCRPTRSKAQSGSFAVSLRTANGIWPILTHAPNALTQSQLVSRTYRNCAPAWEDAVFIGGTPTEPPALIDLDLSTGTDRVVRRSAHLNEEVRSCISRPESITFTTQGGETAHAFFYPPFSHKLTAPQGEQTPVLVKSHGGPTASASSTLSLAVQFWTSRGIGVLDVNYRGSTGYGRSYRLRLKPINDAPAPSNVRPSPSFFV